MSKQYFRGLTEVEYRRYLGWRKEHPCVSQVEISYIPDQVDQRTRVRCLKCNEQIDITDFDCA